LLINARWFYLSMGKLCSLMGELYFNCSPDTSRMVDKLSFAALITTREGTIGILWKCACLINNIFHFITAYIFINILLTQLHQPLLPVFFVYIFTWDRYCWFIYSYSKTKLM
jgi:hypothetical protein